MWWYNNQTGNFHVGEQPTKEVNDEQVIDEEYVVIVDKPGEDYVWDGTSWLTKEEYKNKGMI